MLIKLTPGVDFTNILFTAITCIDHKSAKMTDGLIVFFALLGSALVKAAQKNVDKIETCSFVLQILDL